MTTETRVLVLGGYGFFGRRLVERLAHDQRLALIVAGRHLDAAQQLADTVRQRTNAIVSILQTDAGDPAALAAALRSAAPHIVVNTCGPFQQRDYLVARACIDAGCHYIDLADGRDFVANIVTLDIAARQRGVLIVSGASSVPALSSAALDTMAPAFVHMHSIDIGISPGNRTERGLATVQAILGYCGAPIVGWRDGKAEVVTGWDSTWKHPYPMPVGTRRLSPCDVPDLELFPQRYAGIRNVRFGAGLELGLLHNGMRLLANVRRIGLVRNWAAYAGLLKSVSDWFVPFGSDAGAMHVRVMGIGQTGEEITRTWTLVATAGDGPHVPTLASVALIHRLVEKRMPLRGATPCVGLLDLADFQNEMHDLSIQSTISDG